MDVVSDGKLALSGRVGRPDGIAEVVLSNLNLLAGELVVVIGIQVEVRDNVSELSEDVLADGVARRVRRAHVCRVFANDVADGHLVLDHLVVDLSLGDLGKILVRPSVGSNLVTVGDHASDDRGPLLVDGTLANVDTSDEKGGLETGSSELVQDLVSVDVWTVIISNSNGSSFAACIDTSTAIGDTALLRTGIVTGGGSSRGLVGIAAGTKFEQAVRSVAVVWGVSTVSLCSSEHTSNDKDLQLDIQHQSSRSLQHTWRCQSWLHSGCWRHHPDEREGSEDPEQPQREQHEERVS